MNTKKSKKAVKQAENDFRNIIIEQMNVLGDMLLGKNDENGFQIILGKPIALSYSKTSDDGTITTNTIVVDELYRIGRNWNIHSSAGKDELNWFFHTLDLNSIYQLYCALEQTVKAE